MLNVFEFCGLPKNHRASNKVVQLVKHMQEVPVSKHFPDGEPRIAQVKKDGIFAIVVKIRDGLGGTAVFGRTGKHLSNCEAIASEFANDNTIGHGVYIGELCNKSCSLEVLSGILNPNRTKVLSAEQEFIKTSNYIAFHDFLSLTSFYRGCTGLRYMNRYMMLVKELRGKEYIIPCHTLHTEEACKEFAEYHIDLGEEGAVFKLDCDYEAGHKGYRTIKIVRGISLDLECVGYEEGKGKYAGKVANLLFKMTNVNTGKVETIRAMLGKGWTHEDAQAMWLALNGFGYTNSFNPIGEIFAVTGLQYSSKGLIRLPKVGELRIDKDEADV